MKLLFDQNLSFKLCWLLADLFPGSDHVRLRGLADADDQTVWAYAKTNGFILSRLIPISPSLPRSTARLPRSYGCGPAISRPPW
jgi:Domain of unknown function (DUF5615)